MQAGSTVARPLLSLRILSFQKEFFICFLSKERLGNLRLLKSKYSALLQTSLWLPLMIDSCLWGCLVSVQMKGFYCATLLLYAAGGWRVRMGVCYCKGLFKWRWVGRVQGGGWALTRDNPVTVRRYLGGDSGS